MARLGGSKIRHPDGRIEVAEEPTRPARTEVDGLPEAERPAAAAAIAARDAASQAEWDKAVAERKAREAAAAEASQRGESQSRRGNKRGGDDTPQGA